MNKRVIIAAIILLIAAASSYYIINNIGAEDATASQGEGMPPPPSVAVLELKEQTITMTRSLPGRISAFRQSQIRPQVNGIITERLFEEGAYVEKGQQLYQIDDARYKAELTSADADLKSAKSTIASIESRTKRYQNLVKIDAVSKQEYEDVKAELDQAKAAVAVAQASVDLAQVNLDYTKVYAPISGRIGRSLVTEGALVTANQSQAMAVITLLDPVYVDMQQSSQEAMELQQMRLSGQEKIPVSVLLGESNEQIYPHQGNLSFSEVTIDETTGSITLRATVPNPDGVLMPGLFVRTSLALGKKTALLVPQRASTRNADGSISVMIVDDKNKVQPRAIKVRDAYEDSWIVSEGLAPGDKVIIEGYQKVAPNSVVSVTNWQQAGDGAMPSATPPETSDE